MSSAIANRSLQETYYRTNKHHRPSRNRLTDGKREGLDVTRVGSDHDQKITRLDDKFLVNVPKCQAIGTDFERNCFRFAGLQRYPLKTLQLFHGTSHRTHQVAYIELHRLVAVSFATVGDVDTYGGCLVPRNGLLGQPWHTKFKTSVTQTVTKRIEWRHIVEEVSAPSRRLMV